MPYMMMEEDGKTAVYKKGSDGKPMGKRLGLHPSKEKAQKQIDAIYANEKSLGEKALDEMAIGAKYYDDYPMPMMKLEPSDTRVQYTPLGGSDTQACANCQWFCAHMASCSLIWDDVVATGKCNLWLGKPTPKQPEPIPVVIVEPPEMDMGSEETKPETGKKESKIISWLKETFGKKAEETLPESGFKSLPGNKWVAYFSNNFEDKSGEIFTEAAHDQYISWVDQGLIPMPELWYWHIPGTRHGEAEWVDRVGHIMVAAGHFDDTPMADLFRKEYESNPEKTSFTYGYPKEGRQNGEYHTYFAVEISPLPVGKECNEWTPFMEVKEMPVTPEKITKLEAILGKDLASQVLGNGEKMSKELESLGIKFKEGETLGTVDNDARGAIKELATANKANQDATLKAITDLTALVTKLTEANTKLETYVKEQFADAPRASTAPETVVPKTDPQAAFLAQKALDPNAPEAGTNVFSNIAAMAMKQSAQQTGETQ